MEEKKKISSKKVVIVSIIILLIVIMLIPKKIYVKDCGSVIYKAFLYKVVKYHSMDLKGYRVELFGFCVYDKYKDLGLVY